ncbi:hypothetical protein CO005_00960 [Candidatus Roizmanbacteria bacterium CG_4_8_14_3_um_filter_34_9]|uniref:PIN domain-containing protein n=3 Tax=Candidatus Roizmaniibacteriota TaxID=1752723 RepID=A0A2M7AUP9_9BACT|nr:MAG: hypothetical protein COT02_05875 [Candidatus Roizmanbacteria bacterium CG07_land_8_20_14_0_80_34_15]PIU74360.1 MAG: hypothetical protein COS77_01910 [Candidatus Roizmanbacteria bacterium CG06_land_8_20_14_3_00_34_14]PIW73527.1 MAG: hypothetical protein CO005_00960 [Candidatus Roizmanbacteria bacterium CG_4_8_14_3_um_filter_34_9]
MKPTVVIDTNILLRYLRNDHPTLSIKAKKIFDKAYKNDVNIYFDEIVLAETIWVLSSYFKTPKSIIVSTLLEQLYFDWIINPRKKLMIKALGLFEKTNLSYIDCWIFTVNQSLKTTSLETFDSDLKKLK